MDQDRLSAWEHRIVRIGLFLVFLATSLKFLGLELWNALETFLRP